VRRQTKKSVAWLGHWTRFGANVGEKKEAVGRSTTSARTAPKERRKTPEVPGVRSGARAGEAPL